MKTVGINNLTGVGRRALCPSPSEGVRTHHGLVGMLQALTASSRSWQLLPPGAPGTRALRLGCLAGGRAEELPACLSSSRWVLGQPLGTARGRRVGRRKARRTALAGGMARIGFCPTRSRKHFVPSEPPMRPYCGASPGPRRPRAISGRQSFSHSFI